MLVKNRGSLRWAVPFLGAAFLCLILSACSGPYGSRSMYELEEIAYTNHFKCKPHKAGSWQLMGCEKSGENPRDLYVYIEGDGLAWRTTYEISEDPTPRFPTALKIAVANKSKSRVLYLARPGQYVESPGQSENDWTSGRFSEEIIQAYAKLINRMDASNVHLIGYSGGATIALLLESRVLHLRSITTYAGVLDHKLWTAFHDIAPLRKSLNPSDMGTCMLEGIPVIHYTGSADETVPAELVAQFKGLYRGVPRVQFVKINGYAHDSPWDRLPTLAP